MNERYTHTYATISFGHDINWPWLVACPLSKDVVDFINKVLRTNLKEELGGTSNSLIIVIHNTFLEPMLVFEMTNNVGHISF